MFDDRAQSLIIKQGLGEPFPGGQGCFGEHMLTIRVAPLTTQRLLPRDPAVTHNRARGGAEASDGSERSAAAGGRGAVSAVVAAARRRAERCVLLASAPPQFVYVHACSSTDHAAWQALHPDC